MRHALALIAAVVLSTSAIAEETIDNPDISAIFRKINAGRPDMAVTLADNAITIFESRYNEADTRYYCAKTLAQSLGSLLSAATGETDAMEKAVVVNSDWCEAHFAKGFALIDMHRSDLAEPELRRATEMSPFDAHYLNEYAELFKGRREWQKSYDIFVKAEDVAALYPENQRSAVRARSLRGMGFTKIELGELDEAEKLFRRSLEVEPNNPIALNELQYIARKKAIQD